MSGDVTFPLFNTNGSTAWTAPIPPDAGLIGVRFFAQCLPFDASANPRGIVTTNAGEAMIADRVPQLCHAAIRHISALTGLPGFSQESPARNVTWSS